MTSQNKYEYWPTDRPQKTHTRTGSCAGKLFLLLPFPLAGSLPHAPLSLPLVLCAGFREQWKCYSLLPSLAQFSPFSLSSFPLSLPLSKISCPYFSLPLSVSFPFSFYLHFFFSLINIHSKSPGTYKVSSRVTANCGPVRTNVHSWQTSTGGATRSRLNQQGNQNKYDSYMFALQLCMYKMYNVNQHTQSTHRLFQLFFVWLHIISKWSNSSHTLNI